MYKKDIIYICLIIVLVGLTAGVTYMFMSNKDEKKTNQTLNEEELMQYINYIPNDNMGGKTSAYASDIIKSKDISSNLLLANVLYETLAIPYAEGKSPANSATLDFVNQEIMKKYNLKLDQNLLDNDTSYRGYCFKYNNSRQEFEISECGSQNFETLHIAIEYNFLNNDLIIEEYPVTLWSYFDGEGYYVADFYKDMANFEDIGDYDKINVRKLDIDSSLDYDKAKEYASNYIKNNQNNFTKYKHTFKKNDTGYYWYQTEVVK